jgi:hypothetical protein
MGNTACAHIEMLWCTNCCFPLYQLSEWFVFAIVIFSSETKYPCKTGHINSLLWYGLSRSRRPAFSLVHFIGIPYIYSLRFFTLTLFNIAIMPLFPLHLWDVRSVGFYHRKIKNKQFPHRSDNPWYWFSKAFGFPSTYHLDLPVTI